jgi:hypothetical protein
MTCVIIECLEFFLLQLVNNSKISSTEEQKLKEYNGWIDDEEFDATAEQKLAAIEQVTI